MDFMFGLQTFILQGLAPTFLTQRSFVFGLGVARGVLRKPQHAA